MSKKINSYKADFLIVGAGFAGATFARCAADAGFTVHIIDKRDHIGGNCFSYKDEETGIEVHKYGPHIFHTNSKEIWDFINRFTTFNHYTHRVKANYNGEIFSLPINLHTINQFYRKAFSPKEAEDFIESLRVKKNKVENFEDYILSSLGEDLYKAFFRDYTIKQWGIEPKQIPISTAKRLPIRFNYDDNYFNDIFQGIPADGYTKIFERMLHHDKIQIRLKSSFEEYKENWRKNYRYLVYTGSIDEYFDYEFGYLPYRTVYFEEIRGKEIIGTSVMNFTDMKYNFTRIHEHKWFTPNIKFSNSIAFKEFSDMTDSRKNPYYPIRNLLNDKILKNYWDMAKYESNVLFIGRLAEYRYYDMDQVIGSSLSKFKKFFKK
jgi:UDP-galactopyranose mutase